MSEKTLKQRRREALKNKEECRVLPFPLLYKVDGGSEWITNDYADYDDKWEVPGGDEDDE